MKINLRVEFNNGKTEEVVCSAADLVKFEDKFNVSIARIDQDMRLTHLLFLAHASLTRQKLTNESFDEWVNSVANIGASENDPK